jgi:hypothetical protein
MFLFTTMALYHQDLPGRLFSPQAYLREQSAIHGSKFEKDNCFSVLADRAEWHVNGKRLFTMKYDASYLPYITLFHKDMAHSTLAAMQSVLHHSTRI